MNRRNLIKSLIATTVASSVPLTGKLSAASAAKPFPWKNWSGNLQCLPAARKSPATIGELQELVSSTSGRIRAVGAGHSFSPLVPTDETLLSIRRLSGLIDSQEASQTATVYGGTILSELGPVLNAQNQALINMPDIDQQTLAGAIATATHGTGAELGSLSSYVEGLEIVTADGERRYCTLERNSELFRASQVGLGATGIVTAITMKNTRPFKLKREAKWLAFEDAITQAPELARQNRNFEFYYFPFTGMTLGDYLNISDEPISNTHELDGNSGIMDLKAARDYLSWSDTLRELILKSYMKTIKPSVNIDHSYAIYATERNVRFNEMEYHLPADVGMQALAEIRSVIEKNFPEVFFPIECRFVKAEEAWLSPFYQRDTVSIAVHRYFEEDYKPLYRAVEPILQSFSGRPHWGKINTFSAAQLRDSYPQWQNFLDVRKEYDPNGKFLNAYLERIFGLV